jgi:hypothetical protein
MKKTITLATFRRVERLQDDMMRAAMPRTAAADPTPLVTAITGQRTARRAWSAGSLITKGAFTLAEVARG